VQIAMAWRHGDGRPLLANVQRIIGSELGALRRGVLRHPLDQHVDLSRILF